jgi:hypothetical protein
VLFVSTPVRNCACPLERFIVPEAKLEPSILASTSVEASVVESTFNSILYQVFKLRAELSLPTWASSSSFHSSKVLSVFSLISTAAEVPPASLTPIIGVKAPGAVPMRK